MSNSFQDQFLKAGLTTEKNIKKAKKAKHKKNKQQKKGNTQEVDEAKLLAQKAEADKRQRDRELNRQKEDAAKQKAIIAQIKQLIDMNKANSTDGDVTYNFKDDNLIKHIYVTDKLHNQISQGSFAIVKFEEKYNVVPKIVANKIKDRDPNYIIVLNDATTTEEIDDDYADYTIPDDLMW